MHSLATNTWSDDEIEAGCKALRSGRTTMGERCALFERLFAEYTGTRYAVMVNSGSSANLLMIAALVYTGRLPRGSLVAVPAVSWSTTYAPLEQFGMRMAVVDVDDSMNINPALIPDCDAIFAVNLLGNSCDFDALPDVLTIEDNCESMGAEYGGNGTGWRSTGSIGVMASHSMFFSHHISTMEGGIITTDDEELWRCLLSLRAHGWTRDLPEYERGFHSFDFVVPGFSVRPTEVQGAIGVEQMRRLPAMIEARRKNGEEYSRIIGHQREVGRSSWFGFAVLAPNRGEILPEIMREFEVRPIVAGNIMRHPVAKHFDIDSATCEYADVLHDTGFFIGNNADPCEDALQRLAGYL
jgi:CDP-6-deoxy-D-xylo-4-hexulose-3-dehydrase